jgi:hypothetical protein
LIGNLLNGVAGFFVDVFFNYLFFWIPLAAIIAGVSWIAEWRKRRRASHAPN